MVDARGSVLARGAAGVAVLACVGLVLPGDRAITPSASSPATWLGLAATRSLTAAPATPANPVPPGAQPSGSPHGFGGPPEDGSVVALGQLPSAAHGLTPHREVAPPASATPAAAPAPGTVASGTVASGTVASGTAPPDVGAPGGTIPAGPAGSAASLVAGAPKGSALQRMYGAAGSGLPWLSGFWTGGYGSAAHLQAAGQWRGRPMDLVTTYPAYATWSELADDTFAISTYDGFAGRLSYGLPLLPQDRRGQWTDVTSGAHDAVFAGIARQLVAHGRGDSVVRVGLEANGSWFPWGATAGTADQFRAAFRRVVEVMRAQAPRLTFWFDTSAGAALPGGSSRLDALTAIYPGDDVVDGVSMDHYDFYQLVARTDAQFASAVRPSSGPGLADVADFARAHGKGFAVPEWGIHDVQGPGDNPFFIAAMFGFFSANADVLVYECYFNEPDGYIANALFEASNNPQSAAAYRSRWGRS